MTSPTQTSSTSTPPSTSSTKVPPPPKESGASKGGKGSNGHGSRGGGSSSRGGRGKKRGGGESSGSSRPTPSSSSNSNAQAGPSSHPATPKSSGGGGGGPPRAPHPPNGSSSSNFPAPRGLRPNRGRINIMFRNPRTPASFDTDPDLRATLPKELSKGGGPLHKELMKSWKASLPTPTTTAARKQLIDAISHVVASYGPQFRLALFGSAAIGGDRDQSDMDLCVVDLNSPEGYQIPNGALKATDQIYNPRNLASRLERAGLVGVEAIPWARTPIVKCSDPTSGIEVDINCNDLGGVHNTALILSYCLLAPYTLRPLIHTVKTWAKARKLNDPSGSHGPATFSSYSLNLLCITYLLSGPHSPSLHFPPRVKNPPNPPPAPAAVDPSQIPLPPSNSSSPSNSPTTSTSSLPAPNPIPLSTPSTSVADSVEELDRRSGPLLPSLQSPDLLTRLQIPASHILIRGPSIRHRRNSSSNTNSTGPPTGNTTSSTPELVNTTFAPVESLGEEEVARWKERNERVDVGELAKGFFGWFGEISGRKSEGDEDEQEEGGDWRWDRDVASLLRGGRSLRKDGTEKKWDSSNFVIQDPFIHSKNCAGGIIPGKHSDRILEEFKRAYNILSRGGSFVKEVCEDYIQTEPPVVRRNNRPPPPLPPLLPPIGHQPQQHQPGGGPMPGLGGLGGGGAWGTAGPGGGGRRGSSTTNGAGAGVGVGSEAGMSSADRFFAARMRGSTGVVKEKEKQVLKEERKEEEQVPIVAKSEEVKEEKDAEEVVAEKKEEAEEKEVEKELRVVEESGKQEETREALVPEEQSSS